MSKRHRRQFQLECLEDRNLLSGATVHVDAYGDEFQRGTNGADKLVIKQLDGTFDCVVVTPSGKQIIRNSDHAPAGFHHRFPK